MRNLSSKCFASEFTQNFRFPFSIAVLIQAVWWSGIRCMLVASIRTKPFLLHLFQFTRTIWHFPFHFHQSHAQRSEPLVWSMSPKSSVSSELSEPSAHVSPLQTPSILTPKSTPSTFDESSETSPLVHIECVGKIYRDSLQRESVALREVSFAVHPGEVVGLLGLNGAGKTTLLRILATLLEPTRGDVRVAGYRVTVNPVEVRRQIGFVSASTAGYDRMTAREMVLFFGELHGVPRTLCESRLNQLFDQLQITEFADRFVAQMSTGMRQKVSIARALIHDPAVLILDEATLGLDVPAAHSLLKTVIHLRERGKAIIWSTHVMREVERVCDRVVILHHGEVLLHASLSSLRAEHPHEALDDLFENLVLNEPHLPHVAR